MSTQKNNPQERESKVTETQHRWSERLHSHRQIKTLTGERTQHYTPDRTGTFRTGSGPRRAETVQRICFCRPEYNLKKYVETLHVMMLWLSYN